MQIMVTPQLGTLYQQLVAVKVLLVVLMVMPEDLEEVALMLVLLAELVLLDKEIMAAVPHSLTLTHLVAGEEKVLSVQTHHQIHKLVLVVME